MEKKPCNNQDAEVRKGPWTVEEDVILMNYVINHGEGVWNNIARSAGLRRTGKSCRLRWLNYLKPDVRRGNITPEEQLLIMELHARWGNKWSRIASHLPGRTDNEIKNFWRTRIQKQLKQAESSSNQIVATAQDEGISNACGAKEEDEPFSLPPPPPPPPPTTNTSNPEAHQAPPSMESDDSFWSMEDLLSNQFFNGD